MRRHIQAELWHGVAYQLPGEPDPVTHGHVQTTAAGGAHDPLTKGPPDRDRDGNGSRDRGAGQRRKSTSRQHKRPGDAGGTSQPTQSHTCRSGKRGKNRATTTDRIPTDSHHAADIAGLLKPPQLVMRLDPTTGRLLREPIEPLHPPPLAPPPWNRPWPYPPHDTHSSSRTLWETTTFLGHATIETPRCARIRIRREMKREMKRERKREGSRRSRRSRRNSRNRRSRREH
eukprot:SAG31_NODE_8285_length_1480_cov_12.203476_2_plen_230_part_00